MLKEGSFVIATVPINGIAVNSVGLVNSISDDGASVLFIGKNMVSFALEMSRLSHTRASFIYYGTKRSAKNI